MRAELTAASPGSLPTSPELPPITGTLDRQRHDFAQHPSADILVATASPDIHVDTGAVCGRAPSCLHFASPSTHRVDGGARYQASLTTRPILVEGPATLVVQSSLESENVSGYDVATVEMRCVPDTTWRRLASVWERRPDGEWHVPVTASASSMCAFRIGFDTVDSWNNSHGALRVSRLALRTSVLADADADGVIARSDNCPGHANPSQADSDSDGVGDACELAPPALDPIVVGHYYDASLVTGAPLGTFARVGSLPEGLTATDDLRVRGRPAAEGDYDIELTLFAGDSYTTHMRVPLYVLPVLTTHQRILLASIALHPADIDEGLDVGTVTRWRAAPVFIISDAFRSDIGEPDAAIDQLRSVVDDAVPLMTGGFFAARWADTVPTDGTPFVEIRENPPQGARTVSERRRYPAYASGRVPGDLYHPFYGNGEITSGTVWMSDHFIGHESWELPTFLGIYRHELGHVFNGPHTWIGGQTFVQERGRRGVTLGSTRYEDWDFAPDEILAYQVLYRLPIGMTMTRMERAGLLLPDDLYPEPRIDAVFPLIDRGGWWGVSDAPAGVGSRVRLAGGRFSGFWSCPTERSLSTWSSPEVWVSGGTGFVRATVLESDKHGTRCTRLDFEVPEGARIGPMFVSRRSPHGGLTRSEERILEIVE